jgi:hypothetical protein
MSDALSDGIIKQAVPAEVLVGSRPVATHEGGGIRADGSGDGVGTRSDHVGLRRLDWSIASICSKTAATTRSHRGA